MSKRKTKVRQHKPRNLIALAAFNRAGGAHTKSKSGQRRAQKNKLKREVNRLAKQGDFFMSITAV